MAWQGVVRQGRGLARLGWMWFRFLKRTKVEKIKMGKIEVEVLANVSNGGATAIETQTPYQLIVGIEGTAPILFHAWNCDAVDAKGKASKNSKAKKSDDLESYVYRNAKKELCLPGEYLRQSMIAAAKFKQDPRSPRKSACDLFKAALVSTTTLASLGAKDWDYVDRRRVTIQRNGITRERPAMREGWRAQFDFTVLLPEYVDRHLFADVLQSAGRLIGVGDFRPTFGRFSVSKFE
jgi:hypothetical protein